MVLCTLGWQMPTSTRSHMHKHIFPESPALFFHSNGRRKIMCMAQLCSNYCESSLHNHLTKNWHWLSKMHLSFFLAFLISHKFLILKNRKKRRNTVSQMVMCPDWQTATGQGGEWLHTGEESLSRLQGRLRESRRVSRHHLLIPRGGGLRKKFQKGRAASSWTWPREGGKCPEKFLSLLPGGRRGGGKSMRKGWKEKLEG